MKDATIAKTHKERVVIYTRVSSQKQVNTWNWLESQKQVCMERIKNKWGSIELVDVFSDWWVSGKYSSREGLDSMIEYLHKENKNYTKIDYVLVDDIDRIIRDVAWWREIKAKIEWYGWAKIYSLKQKLEDTPEGNMLQSISMSVKQYERENNARRTADRQRGRLLNGYRCFAPKPWYDFRYADEKNKRGWRVLELEEPNASILTKWYEMFASWVLRTITDFMEYLKQNWYTTKRWSTLRRQSQIRTLLRKPDLFFYAWYIDYEPRDVKMVKWRHPTIISEDTVYKILERLHPLKYKKAVNNTKECNDRELPLRWSLCCESCGKPMTGWPSRNKLWNYYYYYTCRNKWCEQNNKSFNNNKVHDVFKKHLDNIRADEWRLLLLADVIEDLWKEHKDMILSVDTDKSNRIEAIEKELTKVQDRLFNTDQESLVGLYEKKLITLTEEKEKLEHELWSRVIDEIDLPKMITNTRSIILNPGLVWEYKDVGLKKIFVSILFNNQIFYNKKNEIQTPRTPLLYRYISGFNSQNILSSGSEGIEPPVTVPKTVVLPLHQPPKW